MTDSQILEEVYQMLVKKECGFSSEIREVQSFIEQEWQKQVENGTNVKGETASQEVKNVEAALQRAKKNNLEAEVMWTAMRNYEKFHKSAPETYSIEWALECGLNEWDI